MDVFKSKIDKWLLFCLILSIIACLLGASVALRIGGSTNYVFAVFILVAGAGFPLWIMVSTRYIVNGENLEIMSGPFTWNIPLESITALQDSQSASASPALSLDRLEVIYNEDKIILVSPADKMKFIEKLGVEKYTGMRKKDRQRISKDKASGDLKKRQKNRKSL
ncbi:MAG: PH domain-containing protein [Nitrosomonas sp.]|nr:PH domain-containing protein [Nitrosomonas sp.]